MQTHYKGEPIAFRPECEDVPRLNEVIGKTRLTRSELSRRAMSLMLARIEEEGSVGFLFGFDASASTPEAA